MNMKSLRTDDDISETIKKYADMVFKLALSQTKNRANAEDVFQEVFLRFSQSETDFQSEEHLKAWLIKVTLNRSRKLRSSAWARHTQPLETEFAFEASDESDVFFAVMKLPEKYRAVIHLFYYEDMSVKQISLALKAKESTVTSQLCRARAMLKKVLKGEYEIDEKII